MKADEDGEDESMASGGRRELQALLQVLLNSKLPQRRKIPRLVHHLPQIRLREYGERVARYAAGFLGSGACNMQSSVPSPPSRFSASY